MTPIQKAAQINRLLAELHDDLADEDTDWDFDYPALLDETAEIVGNLGDVVELIEDAYDGMDGPGQADIERTVRAVATAQIDLREVRLGLQSAAQCARWVAEASEAANR